MTGVTVAIQPAVMNWLAAQPCIECLDDKQSSSFSAWRNGTKTPTFTQIQRFSRSTGIPLGYFFLKTPPKEDFPLIHYRSVQSNATYEPSQELKNTVRQMENIQDWIKDYKKDNEYADIDIVGSCDEKAINAKKLALTIRNDLSIKKGWYRNAEIKDARTAFSFFRDRLSYCGITIMVNGIVGNNTKKILSVKEFRAFALVDKLAPLIFINGSDSWPAKFFSLLHEAAHIWLGENDLYNDFDENLDNPRDLEVLCNKTASLLIADDEEFDAEWNNSKLEDNTDKIQNLANICHCSTTVIARRALDNGYISYLDYKAIATQAIENYEKTKEEQNSGGNYYLNQGVKLDRIFMQELNNSVKSGKTSYSEAFRLTNTNSKT